MEKQYFYRKHIRGIQKVMPIALVALAALYIAAAVLLLLAVNSIDIRIKLVLLGVGTVITTFIIIEGILIWFFFRRFTKVNVTLTEDYIIYKNIKGETKIAVDEIRKLEFPSIKYTGGWLKIVHPGGNIRLTVVLEGIGSFLKELKAILDRKDKQNTYDPKAMFSFYKTAEFADQSWERLYSIFTKLLLLIGLNLLIGILFFLVSGDLPMKGMWVLASFALPALTYSAAEFVIATAIAKKSDETAFEVPGRDYSFEGKVYRNTILIYSLLYLFVSVILLILSYL